MQETGTMGKGLLANSIKRGTNFIGIELLVQSVPHSGCNEDDYYKATILAYFSAKLDFKMEDVEDKDSLQFKFKEEWEILRDHEKW